MFQLFTPPPPGFKATAIGRSPFSDAHYAALAETAREITKALDILPRGCHGQERALLVRSLDRVVDALSVMVCED